MKKIFGLIALLFCFVLTGLPVQARGQSGICVANIAPNPVVVGTASVYSATGLKPDEYVTVDFGLGQSPFFFLADANGNLTLDRGYPTFTSPQTGLIFTVYKWRNYKLTPLCSLTYNVVAAP
jgi:hypothetical protein